MTEQSTPLVRRILGVLDKEHPFNGFGPEMLKENLRFIDYSMIKCVLEYKIYTS